MRASARCAILLALLLSCREAPGVADRNDPSPVILAFVTERAGFDRPFILDGSAEAPPMLAGETEAAGLDSGVVQVKEALRDLVNPNQKHIRWDHDLIRAAGARPVGRKPGFDSFIWPRRGTVISISAPGLSADSNVAVVYWEYECGSLCAAGEVSVFRRDRRGVWRPWRSLMQWIS